MKINDLKDGSNLKSFECYVGSVTEKETKKGKPYVTVVFKDDTGEIGCNVWDTTKEGYPYPVNTVVRVNATVSSYNSKLQLNVSQIGTCETPLTDFFRKSELNIDKMFVALVDEHIAKIKNPFIKFLAEELILEPRCAEMFCSAPAAKGVHHNWIGGLLEHSYGMCKMADSLYNDHYRAYFPTLDMDMVKFGCMFHDWGKVLEYDYKTPNIGYTRRGCLQHHMGIVAEAIVRKAVKFENGKVDELEDMAKHKNTLHELLHIIYAHHGSPEWGSPVRPATAEALFVHQIDYIDGQMMHMRELIKDRVDGDIPGMSKRSWAHQTQYQFLPEEESF